MAYEWLRENPGQTIESLSKETGVDKRDILRWVREKRLVLAEASEAVRCRKCGKPVRSGNFCNSCEKALSRQVTDGIKAASWQKEAEPSSGWKGMHYNPKRERVD